MREGAESGSDSYNCLKAWIQRKLSNVGEKGSSLLPLIGATALFSPWWPFLAEVAVICLARVSMRCWWAPSPERSSVDEADEDSMAGMVIVVAKELVRPVP